MLCAAVLNGSIEKGTYDMPAIKQDTILMRLLKDVNDIKANLRRVVANLPLYDIDNENTPAQITADQNNYVPGNYDVLRLASDASRSITGISGGVKGRKLRLFNVGSYPITLAYEDAGSLAANRFKFSNGNDAVIPPSSNMLIYYDATQQRWIGGDTASSGAVYLEVENLVAQSIPDVAATKIDPGTVISDQYGFYDDANNEVVIQFPGAYQITFTAVWAISLAVEYPRYIAIYVDGVFAYSADLREQFPHAGLIYHQIQFIKTFATGAIIEFYAYHDENAGGALNLNKCRITLLRIT